MNDQDTSTETAQPTGLRASNTLQTLKPVEVNADNIGNGPGPQYADFAGLCLPASISPELDPFKTYDPVQCHPQQRPTLFTQPEPFETLNVSHVKDDPIWIISAILDRVEVIEDKVASLLARIELHNVRSSHKI